MKKRQEISQGESLKILGGHVSDIALAAATSIAVINPPLGLLLLSGRGIYTAWGEFGQARLNELLLDLESDVDSIKKEVVNKDEFKGLFLNILDKHMRETSISKREYLRRYLISAAQGKRENFSNHTKLLLILDQITADELRLFMLLPSIVEDSIEEIESVGGVMKELDMNSTQVQMRLCNWTQTKGQIETLLRFLGNYGLIISNDVSLSTIGGGSTHLNFKGLTEVGWAFYNFLDHPSIDKKVNQVR